MSDSNKTGYVQLEMVRGPEPLPPARPLPDDYILREIEESDRGSYWRLFRKVFDTNSRLDDLRTKSLSIGFMVIEHAPTAAVVASAAAADYERKGHDETGSLQWVMADPAHSGKGLGAAVVAAATQRLVEGGYRRVYLSTDDWRLPAINVYLKLGWKPYLFAPPMEARWREVFAGLGREYDPGDCAG